MKKTNLPEKDIEELVATILSFILMVIWTVGAMLGIFTFANSCERDDPVTAHAFTETQVNASSIFACKIPKGTSFYVNENDNMAYEDEQFLVHYRPVVTLSLYAGSDHYSTTVRLVDNEADWLSNPQDSMLVTMPDYSDSIVVNRDYWFYFSAPEGTPADYVPWFIESSVVLELGWFDPFNVQIFAYQCNVASDYMPITGFDMLLDSYNTGYADAESVWYRKGYKDGERDGKEIGKLEGIASANDYSFIQFFGAVIDAPISAIRGLLSFEILGINLASFFLSLLTVAMIIAIVRFVL